jgi:hypothetical protein
MVFESFYEKQGNTVRIIPLLFISSCVLLNMLNSLGRQCRGPERLVLDSAAQQDFQVNAQLWCWWQNHATLIWQWTPIQHRIFREILLRWAWDWSRIRFRLSRHAHASNDYVLGLHQHLVPFVLGLEYSAQPGYGIPVDMVLYPSANEITI